MTDVTRANVLISNFLLLIRSGLWMYFYRMHVLFFDLVLSSIMVSISCMSFATWIPTPLFVFSPGFKIQILCVSFSIAAS